MRVALFVSCLVALAGCGKSEIEVYTLYRTGDRTEGKTPRVHMATFDSKAGGDVNKDYNMVNCEIARDLWQSQKNVQDRYWCEKGRFKE